MIVKSFDLEKYMDEHMNSTNYLLRVMKYTGPQTAETKLGLNAHTDKNIVTILYQNQISGLEVQTKNGEWIQVKPSPDSFIAMIGDSLYVSLLLLIFTMKSIYKSLTIFENIWGSYNMCTHGVYIFLNHHVIRYYIIFNSKSNNLTIDIIQV